MEESLGDRLSLAPLEMMNLDIPEIQEHHLPERAADKNGVSDGNLETLSPKVQTSSTPSDLSHFRPPVQHSPAPNPPLKSLKRNPARARYNGVSLSSLVDTGTPGVIVTLSLSILITLAL